MIQRPFNHHLLNATARAISAAAAAVAGQSAARRYENRQ
jgi:hypothetical protein